MSSIRVFDKLYLHDELIHLKQARLDMLNDEDEKAAVLFLHQWLSGEQQFNQHTSGSTGEPKMISISREQMEKSARLTGDYLQFNRLKKALLPISARYIGGKMLLVRAFIYGLDIEVIKPASDFLIRLDPFHPYQLVSVVPSQLAVVNENKRTVEALTRFDTVLIGGASLTASIEKKLQSLESVNIWQTYGMTETVSHIALRKVNGATQSDWYEPLPGIEIKTDERGCLCIKASVTHNEWLGTNDVVELQGGKFKISGRYDEVINSGGVKVFPSKTEQAVAVILNEMNISCNFFAGALPDERLGQKLVLVMEGPALKTAQMELIKQRLKAVLPAYHTPGAYFFVERFLLLPSGKINKVRVLQSFLKDS